MKRSIQLIVSDLNPQGGIFCPSKQAGMQLWSGHPRVFLDVGKHGQAKCPYCGTEYTLKSVDLARAH